MSKQRQRPNGYSDDEIATMDAKAQDAQGFSDDDIARMDDEQRYKPMSRNEQNAALAMRPLDIASFGYGPEVVAASNHFLGGDSYDEELKRAEDLKGRYNAQTDFFDPYNLVTGAAGLFLGAGPAKTAYTGALGAVRAGRAALGLTPRAVSAVGGAVERGTAAALTGAGGSAAYDMSDQPNDRSFVEKVENIDPMGVAAGAAIAPVVGFAGNRLARGAQAVRQAIRPDANQAARAIADRLVAGGSTPEELAARQGLKVMETGKAASLADNAPEAVQDLGEQVINSAKAQADKKILGHVGPALVELAATGNFGGFLTRHGMTWVAQLLRRVGRGKREQIAHMLFSKDQEQVKRAAQMIQAEFGEAQQAARTRYTASQVGAAQAGQAAKHQEAY